jgi:hypothetical protein
MNCSDTTSPITDCYDASSQTIIPIPPNAPDPTPQPVTTGT